MSLRISAALLSILALACGESSTEDARSDDDAGSTVGDAAGGAGGAAARGEGTSEPRRIEDDLHVDEVAWP